MALKPLGGDRLQTMRAAGSSPPGSLDCDWCSGRPPRTSFRNYTPQASKAATSKPSHLFFLSILLAFPSLPICFLSCRASHKASHHIMKSCDGWAGGLGWRGGGGLERGNYPSQRGSRKKKTKKKVTGWRRQLAFVDTPLAPPHRRLLPAFISHTLCLGTRTHSARSHRGRD